MEQKSPQEIHVKFVKMEQLKHLVTKVIRKVILAGDALMENIQQDPSTMKYVYQKTLIHAAKNINAAVGSALVLHGKQVMKILTVEKPGRKCFPIDEKKEK
jgi:hypothetical protein